MKIISREEFSKATRIDKVPLPGLASALMEIMKINEVNDTFKKASHLTGMAFVDKILQILGIKIELNEQELKNLPKQGAFITIANHPYGGIEGLVLLKILCTIRPEAKLMANFILQQIPNLKEFLIAVNPFEKIDHSSSITGIKTTLALLQQGIPVGIFPAGEVSTYQIRRKEITDRMWHPVVGKIIQKAGVPVIPIYFHGNNGLMFNLLSLIHSSLRTAKLPSELFNKHGHIIRVRVGKPIPVKEMSCQESPVRLLNYLRAKTYALGAALSNDNRLFDLHTIIKLRKPDTINHASPRAKLISEVNTIQNDRVWVEKKFEVYISPATKIPNILPEIGRLREITFREVGEGTNKSTDLDEYDAYYHHLFIWDTESSVVVGAYRIGRGDKIYQNRGTKGFYLAELFKIREQLNPILQKSLELGRSWIRKEYQKKALPLYLLWKGIFRYLLDKPQYHYLLGPVSISNNFSKFSRSLIVSYITKNHFDPQLAKYVLPRNKFKADFSNIDPDVLLEAHGSFKDLDDLISGLETSNRRIPVLLRQYLALNAKILCFNLDPKFANSLDGFLIVDLQKIPAVILEKLGREGLVGQQPTARYDGNPQQDRD